MTDVKDLQGLLRSLQTEFSTTTLDILRYEFPVYAALHFGLHLNQSEYLPHLHRIIDETVVEAVSVEDYIGGSMYAIWRQALMEHVMSEKERELEEEGDGKE